MATALFRSAFTLLIVAGAVWGSQSQPAGQAPVPQAPTFRGGANLVRVDVTAIDKHGAPIKTLNPDDFEVREDGILQAVEAFRLIEANGQPTDDLSLAIRSREHAAAEAARDEVRVFLIFWDEYHIAPASADDAREMLNDFVEQAVGPTDLVAVMDQLTVLDAIRFTRDRDELLDTISWLDGRAGRYFPTRSAVEDAQVQQMGDVGRLRGQVSSSAVRAAILHLGSLREGRKTLILVTAGLTGPGRDATVADLARTANANNTAIAAIDPNRIDPFSTAGPHPEHLISLTQSTGGATIGPDDGTRALHQIVREASAFYLLGYSSSQSPFDGRFHKITVRVKKQGVEVRARNGYIAPSAQEIERARAMAAAAERTPEVSRALAELSFARRDRPFDLWMGAAQGPNGPRVTAVWSPKGALDAAAAPRSVRLVAVGVNGRTHFDGLAEPDRPVTFDAPPGTLTVTATARNQAEEWVGRDTRSLEIPDMAGARIAIATPVVLRARNQLAATALLAVPDPPPFPGREFTRTDRVFVLFTVHGGDRAAVSAALLNERGARLVAVPVARMDSGMYRIDVPLSSIAPGDYLVSIDARGDDDAAQTLVPLRVVR